MCIQGDQMKFHGYDSLLTLCIDRKAIREGQRVHAHMIKSRYLPPAYLGTRLIVLYTKCNSLKDARQVLDGMPERSVVSWTAMISAYAQRGYHTQAWVLFNQMLKSGTPPNEFTFASVLTCGFEKGVQVHSLIIKTNYESQIFVGSSLIDMYAKAGRIHDARGVFERLPERDVVSCTAIISGYAQLSLDEEALEMFRQLLREGMDPNYVTYASVLTALSGLAALDHGRQIHNRVLRSELPHYAVLNNSLIDMYSKCGSLTYSRTIFDGMTERTVSTWNAMLVGYSKHGLGSEVIELFQMMREEGKVRPDSITLMAVLSGCSHGALVDEGLAIYEDMMGGQDGFKPELEHYGCVVDLLGRAGQVDKAFEFIKQMPYEPTAAILGSLLGACRTHNNLLIGELVAHRLFEIEPHNAGNYVILSNLYASAGRWEDMRNLRELMKGKAVTKEPGRSWVKLDQTVHTFHAEDKMRPSRCCWYLDLIIHLVGQPRNVESLGLCIHFVDDKTSIKSVYTFSLALFLYIGLTGTKLGCGEGGCGACTVMVSYYDQLHNSSVHYAVNACLAPLYSVEGMHVITVEGVGNHRSGLHPVQESLARSHGSQCGYCTPGFVMSMYALLRSSRSAPREEQIEECLAGNLCRCTGYRPIVDAFRVFAKTDDAVYANRSSGSSPDGEFICPST
ncbi:Pentatricopeptide repeat-containing protein, partial [Thalictrum thalictroides]